MSKASLAPTAVSLAAVLIMSPSALAAPVTDADLRGKTICWSNGGTRSTYGKDGSFESNLIGRGTWSLVGDRLTENGDHGVFSFTITKEGETFHMYGVTSSIMSGWRFGEATANRAEQASVWNLNIHGLAGGHHRRLRNER
jgi:hypothetical protein